MQQQQQHPSDPNPQILWKLLDQQVPAKCSGRKKRSLERMVTEISTRKKEGQDEEEEEL